MQWCCAVVLFRGSVNRVGCYCALASSSSCSSSICFPALATPRTSCSHNNVVRIDPVRKKRWDEAEGYRFTFFFHLFFFIANFCLFFRKGKSSAVTAQLTFFFFPRVITIYYAGNPYLCYGAKIILPPPTQYPPSCLSPPPPRHPVAADTMAVLVVGVMVNYILPLRKRALLPPNAKRPARIY